MATRYKLHTVLDRSKVWIGGSNRAQIMDVNEIL
jgi:hypothetical protein